MFQKKFFEKTSNKWQDREYFREKAGKFVLQDKAKKKQIMQEAFETEKELIKVMKESHQKHPSNLQEDLKDITNNIFDLQGMKNYMADLGLDLTRLPVGKLTVDKIKRAHQVLSEIQRLLVTGEKP